MNQSSHEEPGSGRVDPASASPADHEPHRLLLDSSSLMYRAFFALPATIRGRDGRPVNAVFGYLDMTARLLDTQRPQVMIHVYDHTIAPIERLHAYPEYKANRRPDPEGLPEQFDLLDLVLDAFGAERATAVGWEADDAIAALCARAVDDQTTAIVTGDRDLLQLVRDERPAVRVLFTVKGVSELAVLDEAAVAARYGVAPARYVDLAILRGDPSDGLPGVRGIGERTASRLLGAHATLGELLDGVDRLPERIGSRLRQATEYIRAMRQVVPVRADVSVTLRRREPDPDRLRQLAEERNLKGPIQRLAKACGLALTSAEGRI